MPRGGKREGAGRPKKKYKTVIYYRTVRPEWVKILDKLLKMLKGVQDEKGNQDIFRE